MLLNKVRRWKWVELEAGPHLRGTNMVVGVLLVVHAVHGMYNEMSEQRIRWR